MTVGTAMAPGLDSELARSFSDIPEVESVYVSRDEGVLSVCIFVNGEDDGAYDRIYDREIDWEKKSGAYLDFRVIARRDRPIQEFVGSSIPAWERRAEEPRAS